MKTLFTVGYGAWPAAVRLERLVGALKEAGVTVLVDTRHSPCSSALDPKSTYGPKPWSLQVTAGIQAAVESAGIRYVWLVELGNPQKNDPKMAVLKAQLADTSTIWPVQRGLTLLAELVRESPESCC